MKEHKIQMAVVAGAVMVAVAAVMANSANADAKGDSQSKTSQSSVVTNDNGSVSRTFTESTVTTNGNMVTERRRETRTTLDPDGNMLATATSEYAQSYAVGGLATVTSSDSRSLTNANADADQNSEQPVAVADSFLGLKFGEQFTPAEGEEFVNDDDEPTLLRAKFAPKKTLAGFDDYYVYVTPTSHKVVKVYACARQAIDNGAGWRRNYLIEALEKRYHTWARPCDFWRPYYRFDIGSGRYVTVCLAGASRAYSTVVVAWDNEMLTVAADEKEELRRQARKAAFDRRNEQIQNAADAF